MTFQPSSVDPADGDRARPETEGTGPGREADVVGAEFAERSSVESLVRNFEALLADADLREALDILEVGPFRFSRRRRLKREFRSLYVGLWRLALRRSFPRDYDAVFHAYMERQAARAKEGDEEYVSVDLVLQYVDKLKEHGDSDFFEVSRHILSLLEFDETRTRVLLLKLALHLRRMYRYFFDHLL